MKLPITQATESARRLMAIVKTNQQWNIVTVEGCLPYGWELNTADEADFHPCTVKTFTVAFRAYAKESKPCKGSEWAISSIRQIALQGGSK